MKKHKQHHKRRRMIWVICIFFVVDVISAGLFLWMLKDTAQVSGGCKIVSGNVESMKVVYNPGRSDQLLFTVNGEPYILYWHAGSRYSESAAKRIAQSTQVLTFKIPEYQSFIVKLRGRTEVVDVRSTSEIYYDISSHNAWQKSQRIAGIIIFSFIWLFLFILQAAAYWYARQQPRKQRKK